MLVAALLTSIFLQPLLAGTSISGIATCVVPHIITMNEEQEVLAEEKDDVIIIADADSGNLSSQQKLDEIIQQQIIVSEETKEVELIKTVCAR